MPASKVRAGQAIDLGDGIVRRVRSAEPSKVGGVAAVRLRTHRRGWHRGREIEADHQDYFVEPDQPVDVIDPPPETRKP